MFQAQYLPALASASNYAVFSPWMQRGGDNVRATVDVIAKNGSAGITVSVYHKNSSETGDGLQSGSSFQSTSGRVSAEFSSLKELVRFKFDPGSTTGEWVMFRMLPVIWFDGVKAPQP
jgi:hypothetical protein